MMAMATRAVDGDHRSWVVVGGQGRRVAKNDVSSSAHSAARDAGPDLDLVVEARVGAEVVEAPHGAGLHVVRAEDDTCDACHERGAGAHRARFEGGHQGGAVETGRPDRCRRVAQRQQLGVRRGIAEALAFVVASGHDDAVDDDCGADGYVVVVEGLACLVDRQLHEVVVGHVGQATPSLSGRHRVARPRT